MKKIIVLLTFCFMLGACATPYKPASKHTSNGYFNTLLQEGVYDVSFKGNSDTSIKRAKDFALLRAAEVCLENGNKSFVVINSDNNSQTDSTVVSNTNAYTYSYSYLVSETIPHVSLVIKCSPEEDLFFKAEDIKTNLRKKYNLK